MWKNSHIASHNILQLPCRNRSGRSRFVSGSKGIYGKIMR